MVKSYGWEFSEVTPVEGLVQSKYSIKGNDDGVNVHYDDNDADEWNNDLHYGDTI